MNQEGGRVAYHGYQSFREGEVDADTAHNIGVELAQELWGDRFEVVVATHLNTGHYHNHFCLNSVSFRDGYKYHDTKEDIRRMRDVSDAICRAHRLSIESAKKSDQIKRKNYREWKDLRDGNPTLRGKVMKDIDDTIKSSRTVKEFASKMKDMGYKFILVTETGKEQGLVLFDYGDFYCMGGIFPLATYFVNIVMGAKVKGVKHDEHNGNTGK